MSGMNRAVGIGRLALALALQGVVSAQKAFAEAGQELKLTAKSAGMGFSLMDSLRTSYRHATSNGGNGRGNAARQQRQARKMKNVRARSSKRA